MYPARLHGDEAVLPDHDPFDRDFADLLPQRNLREAISDCRWLAIGSDIVSGALQQKSDYVSASNWATHFAGADRAWGEAAEEKCQQLDRLFCTRGDRYDWRTFWKLTIAHCATDGALFLNLTETDTGWPLVQPIEAHRVGYRDTYQGQPIADADRGRVLSKSARAYRRGPDGHLQRIYTPYAGLRIVAGIIFDDSGREVAYRVLGEAADGSEDVDVSAQDMIHLAFPRWCSEGRPMPEIAPSASALQQIHEARRSQLVKHIDSARRIAIEENQTGLAPAELALGGPDLAARRGSGATKVVNRGLWQFTKTGNKVTPWDTKTPPGEWMQFDDKTVASALHALGWRAEMQDPSGLKGANTRGFADQINTTILEAFAARVPAIQRVRAWQIAKLIQRGDLKANDEWWKWGVTPPPEFSPDPGRAINSELDAIRAGAQSMPDLHRKWGLRSREVLIQQAQYLKLRQEIADEYGLKPDQLGTTLKVGDSQVTAGVLADEKSQPEQEPAQVEQSTQP